MLKVLTVLPPEMGLKLMFFLFFLFSPAATEFFIQSGQQAWKETLNTVHF